ncbi:uncharacterized protein LOC121000797 [Bufo bufo]|uniref:uncharacterized protein LOC121000797 n=1 Tax=Bufo bufo TaxID=8384 RepID=UPI001ABEBF6E|nr:uncharacterized protein LOC121000797 [Bufo bufo]
MADRRVIEVSGFPRRPYDDDFIRDQLLLHFLRPRNGGAYEVEVRYPTGAEGVASLVFEDEEVAKRILGRKHSLVIEDCTHPLEVRRPQPRGSQFSMPVKTLLDLSYFSDVPEVKRLLLRRKLSIYCERGVVLGVQGEFCDLRRCRQDLYRILFREKPKHNSPAASGNRSEDRGRRAPPNPSTTPERKSPSSSGGRRPEGRGHSARDVTEDNQNRLGSPTQHPRTSPQNSSPKVARPPTPTRIQTADAATTLSHTFPVDPAVVRYLRTCRQDALDHFLRQRNIQMKFRNHDGFTSITLTSQAPAQPELFREACDDAVRMFDAYHRGLREANIELPRGADEELIQRLLLSRDICSAPGTNNSLDLIGPPERVLNFLQEWKGTHGRWQQGSGSPIVGMDLATHPAASVGRVSGREAGQEAQVRERESRQDGAGSGRGKSSGSQTRKPWK